MKVFDHSVDPDECSDLGSDSSWRESDACARLCRLFLSEVACFSFRTKAKRTPPLTLLGATASATVIVFDDSQEVYNEFEYIPPLSMMRDCAALSRTVQADATDHGVHLIDGHRVTSSNFRLSECGTRVEMVHTIERALAGEEEVRAGKVTKRSFSFGRRSGRGRAASQAKAVISSASPRGNIKTLEMSRLRR
jgi:hypothetical protein